MGERTRTWLRRAGATVAISSAVAVWVVPIALTTSADDCPIAPGSAGGTRWVLDGNRYEAHPARVRQMPAHLDPAGSVELRACENRLLESYPALAIPGVPVDRAFLVASTGRGETSRFLRDTLFVAEDTDLPDPVRSLFETAD